MARHVTPLDDGWVDTNLYIDSKSLHIEGNPTLVSGSARVSGRDPGEVQWYGRQMVEVIPIPIDQWGDPMRYCSGGHYESKRGFRKDKSRKDGGLDHYCIRCRKTQEHNHKLLKNPTV